MEVEKVSTEEAIEAVGLDEWINVYPDQVQFVYPDTIDKTMELYERYPIVREIINTELDERRINDALAMKGYFHERRGRQYAVTKERLSVFDD